MRSALIPEERWLPGDATGITTGTPAVPPPRSSRTGGSTPQASSPPHRIKIRPGSRRSKSSSHASFMGEHPNPWDRLQPQDEASRHRRIEPRRRWGLSGATDLLSPGNFDPMPPGATYVDPQASLGPPFGPARAVALTVRPPWTISPCTLPTVSIRVEGTFGRLRYIFGGSRSS